MLIDNLTLLTCSFNSNLLITLMLKSFYKQIEKNIPIIIMDNSTKEFCTEEIKKNFNVIDNTNFKLVPNFNQVSKNHCACIDYAFKNCINTKYVLLCDCDILFKPTVKNLLYSDFDFDIAGEIGWDITPPNRLFPYFCIINIEKFNKEKKTYFDLNRCINFYDINGKELQNNIGATIGLFDTGASFYEDVKESWKIKEIKLVDYIVHLKGGTFREKNIYEWLELNKEYFS